MEEKSNSIWKDALKPALILSLIMIILSVIIYVFNLITLSLIAGLLIGVISFIIAILIFTFGIKSYRKEKFDGFLSYGKALVFGIIIALYSSVIITAYNTVFNTVIDPDYEKNIAVKMQEKTEAFMMSKGLPDEAIEDAMQKSQEKIKKSEEQGILLKTSKGFLGNFIMYVIAVLIAAAFAKKNKDPYQEAMQDAEE